MSERSRPKDTPRPNWPVRQDYAADVAAMRTDFADELADEGEGLTDEEVMRACWENDVREPYFELQYEEPVW